MQLKSLKPWGGTAFCGENNFMCPLPWAETVAGERVIRGLREPFRGNKRIRVAKKVCRVRVRVRHTEL